LKNLTRASTILEDLLARKPPEPVTLDWLTRSLQKHSFGLFVLLFAVVAAVPGISVLGALLLLIPATQMILGLSAPSFPRWIAARPLPARAAAPALQRAVSILKSVEKAIYPRCAMPPQPTKRLVGTVVLVLTTRILLVPLPFSNVIPAVLIALISLAYLEEDGVLLLLSTAAAFLLLVMEFGLATMITRAAHHFF
jgi:hypothetical protein